MKKPDKKLKKENLKIFSAIVAEGMYRDKNLGVVPLTETIQKKLGVSKGDIVEIAFNKKMLKNGRIHFAHSNGIFLPTVVMNGQIVGTWKRNLDKGKATVTLTPFVKFTSEQIKNIKNVVNEYGEFLKTDITLRL